MTRKELKKIALRIAKLDRQIRKSTSTTEQTRLENEMYSIIKTISFEDLIELDELIQTKFKYLLDK